MKLGILVFEVSQVLVNQLSCQRGNPCKEQNLWPIMAEVLALEQYYLSAGTGVTETVWLGVAGGGPSLKWSSAFKAVRMFHETYYALCKVIVLDSP